MKHLFQNFEDNSDVFGIKRISLDNDLLESSMNVLVEKYIKNFLNHKNNYCFRYVCVEKYYSEISYERAAIGMMDDDIMRTRMGCMVFKRREV